MDVNNVYGCVHCKHKKHKNKIILANRGNGHLGALRWGSPFPELDIQNGPVSDHPDRESCHEPIGSGNDHPSA